MKKESKLNRWLDSRSDRTRGAGQKYGGVGLDLFLGMRRFAYRNRGAAASGVHLALATQAFTEPGIEEPGEAKKAFLGTFFNAIDFDTTLGTGGHDELNLDTGVLLWGRYGKALDAELHGSVRVAGLGAGFSLFRKQTTAFYDSCTVKVRGGEDLQLDVPRDFRDKIASIHILGPMFDGQWRSRWGSFRLRLEASLDMALVNAFALNSFSVSNDIRGIPNTLRYYGYYYAWGGAGSAELSWRYRGLDLGVRGRYQAYRSLENTERFPEDVTHDLSCRDSRWTGRAWFRWAIPGTCVRLAGSAGWMGRGGWIAHIHVTALEFRTVLGLSYGF